MVRDMVSSSQPSHYLPPTSLAQHKAPTYEYRSPTQSPHHLVPRHTPSPHHAHMTLEAPQNLAGKGIPVHHRSDQQSSPHTLHRQSPHALQQQQQQQPHSSPPEQRYSAAGGPGSLPYGSKTATVGSYQYPAPAGHNSTHYGLATGGSVTAGSKPKVSSPAPPHIYGKSGITTGTPVCRSEVTNVNSGPLPLTSKAPLMSSVSPSPYQQMSPNHHPPPHQATAGPPPPPAHSRGSIDHRSVYDHPRGDKDSDSGASTNQSSGKKSANGTGGNTTGGSSGGNKEPRKRGRPPKSSKNDRGEEPRNKKSKDDPPAPQRYPFRKPPVSQLKKNGESFLQDGPCHEVAPKLAKCRECRWTRNQRPKNMPNIFCRFYAFRRLQYTKNGQLAIAGFSDPHKDASEEDLKLWLPDPENPPADLDLEISRFLLAQVGDQFCDLLEEEKESIAVHMSEDKTIAWKRVVQGVREMCDVCKTTIFNFHWACGKCGFVVCIDCYKSRKNGTVKIWGEPGKDRDDFSWLLCTNRQAHEQEKLMLTQITAGDSLIKLWHKAHELRNMWGIPQYCGCAMSKETSNHRSANGICKDSNGTSSDSDEEKEANFSTLRELLIRPSHKPNSSGSCSASPASSSNSQNSATQNNTTANSTTTTMTAALNDAAGAVSATNAGGKGGKKSRLDILDQVISSVIEHSVQKKDSPPPVAPTPGVKPTMELKHFVRRHNWQQKGREPLSIRIMTLTESKILYPDVPHSWLCDGKLLRLHDPNCENNYRIFQDQWKRGQPVIVSEVTKHLDMSLWHPDSFARDFGEDKNDLINCMTGNVVPNQPMRKFWEGFEHLSRRLKDDRGNPMLLKLKDWPPDEDFAEMLPSRFSDLMRVLPLAEYTHRTGRLNLASRLPECFVRPDLGPKMYSAYGSAFYPTKGTTNLHLDISDAINVMVYVGIPKDGDDEEHIKEAYRAIDEAGCDILTRRRVREKGELPGALWHIYNAQDADKIRDLLNKVAIEKGARLEPHDDPIHDQSWYLDGPLRERLYKEYGVEGYAIVQCLGDSVFIPAGAPHQVRNIHTCIKVAEDFVSPENVSHCFHLTQEFQELSDTHSNHEDKLQIKNIIYHAVKDSLSVLTKLAEGSEEYLANLNANAAAAAAAESATNGSNVSGEATPGNTWK